MQDCLPSLLDSRTGHYISTACSTRLWLIFLANIRQGRALERGFEALSTNSHYHAYRKYSRSLWNADASIFRTRSGGPCAGCGIRSTVGPMNLTLFTRSFLTGRCMWYRYETWSMSKNVLHSLENYYIVLSLHEHCMHNMHSFVLWLCRLLVMAQHLLYTLLVNKVMVYLATDSWYFLYTVYIYI